MNIRYESLVALAATVATYLIDHGTDRESGDLALALRDALREIQYKNESWPFPFDNSKAETQRFYFDSNQIKAYSLPTRAGVLALLAEEPDNYNGFMNLVAFKNEIGVKPTVVWFRSYHRPSAKAEELITLAEFLRDWC